MTLTVSPASLSVVADSAPIPIGIAEPVDARYPCSQLHIVVTALLIDGMLYQADGVTPVLPGQLLTADELSSLTFAGGADAAGQNGQFTYVVSGPGGTTATGTAALSVVANTDGPQTSPAELTVAANSDATPIDISAPTDPNDPTGSLASIAPSGNVLTVGPGMQFSTIAAAISASHDGDTIQVQAGTYVNDFAQINTSITLEGVGGMVNMVATEQIPNGKAILVTDGNVTINNFSFSGAKVSDGNGAGIRQETGNLTLNSDAFFGNQNGILTASDSSATITINHSEFANNGAGDGFTHNLYVGGVKALVINDSYFHDANVGHEIKSRALNTTIENSRIVDGPAGTASYSIDLPNGGNAVIQNNIIQQGPLTQNPVIITTGEEGNVYANSSLTVIGNTILNDDPSSSVIAIRNDRTTTAQITGNQFFGLTFSQIAAGANTQSNNVFLTSEPTLDTTHPWSPEIACYLRGTSILAEMGEVAIEELAIGDKVMTITGAPQPIRWIGRRTYGARPVADNRKILPVRIAAGALDDG